MYCTWLLTWNNCITLFVNSNFWRWSRGVGQGLCISSEDKDQININFVWLFLAQVGHDLAQDAVLLQKNYGESTNNLVDTLIWAKEMDCDPLSLRAMCAIFLHKRLSKVLQQSDWSKDLTEKQLLYAATDAWASLGVYEEMKR